MVALRSCALSSVCCVTTCCTHSLVKKAQWTDWTMVLAAASREYNGERRMRYSVTRVSPLQQLMPIIWAQTSNCQFAP